MAVAVRLKKAPRLFLSIVAAIALLALMAAAPATAFADGGNVYSCAVHPVYRHPVTGAIEDAGGASAAATGQAMVDSCVAGQGMMEVTDSGDCYLTIRLSLIDLTSGHAFQVQDWGASGWSTPALGVTATGSDANGTTNDVCIGLPSQRGIVRVSMFVESMGRDVVFYAYADGLAEGAPSGFTPTIVTSVSSGGAAAAVAAETASAEATATADASEGDGATGSTAAGSSDAEGAAGDAAADKTAGDLANESGTVSAQGLSLSTAPVSDEALGAADVAEAAAGPVSGMPFLFAVAAVVVAAGVVLMLVAACIVYVFRRNWARWGGVDSDDYSWEYRDARRRDA